MINNARAESDAMSARGGDQSAGAGGFGDERGKGASLPLADSDGEGSYDDEYVTTPRHEAQRLSKRESV